MSKGFVLIDRGTVVNILKAELVGHQYKLSHCVQNKIIFKVKIVNSHKCIGCIINHNEILVKVKILIHMHV